MVAFWKKKKEESFEKKGSVSFFEWAAEKDFFSTTVDPIERTQKLLREIQKRSLAEQVFILTLNPKDKNSKTVGMTPSGEKPILSEGLLKDIIQKGYEEKNILLWEDFWEDDNIRKKLQRGKCHSLLLSVLNYKGDQIDALLLVNYSQLGDPGRLIDFASFVSSVLTLSLQNARLYHELKKKRSQLHGWVQHVEERIEEGTKKFLEREFQYHVLFEGTNDGIIIHDINGQLIEANLVACQRLGYTRRELLKINWNELATANRLSEQNSFFTSVLRREKVAPIETELKKKDGEPFQAEISSRKVWFRGEEVIQSLIRDVSFRKAIEESMQESKEKYRILVESSLVGVFIIQNCQIQFVNGTFIDFIGYSREELLERDFLSLVAPEDRSMVSSRETRRENGEEVIDHYEVRFIKKGEEKCWGEVRARCVIIGDKPAVLGNVIDVTQRKQLEMQLFESQKMESIGTLAGGIAHDFNNLLGGILGYASLLLSDMPKNHPHYDDVYTIAETAKRAADLTNRLLAFARGGKYQVTSIDINRSISDVIAILSHTIDRSITIETFLTEKIWSVRGDSQQLHQVILNICLNAVDAIKEGGRIAFATENIHLDEASARKKLDLNPGDYVQVTISDNGVGMDEKTKSRIFEPFFTTKPAGEGTGLGLAMVYGIIKNHEGAINVDSERGKGTKLTLYLPRFIKEGVSSSGTPAGKQELKRILLVDDEKVIRHVGQRMLERGGYHVYLARNGIEAIDFYSKNKDQVDAVIMDLIMPEMGGHEAFRKIKEINPDAKIVLTSGYRATDQPELKKYGKVPFIQKPFQADILIQTMENIFSQSDE